MAEITKIENGTVIDHIKAGMGIKVIEALNLIATGNIVSMISNAVSQKMGKKIL